MNTVACEMNPVKDLCGLGVRSEISGNVVQWLLYSMVVIVSPMTEASLAMSSVTMVLHGTWDRWDLLMPRYNWIHYSHSLDG